MSEGIWTIRPCPHRQASGLAKELRAKGIECEMPDAGARERINNTLTLDELVYGRFEESTRSYFKQVIREAQGFDSTRILARAALRAAVGP